MTDNHRYIIKNLILQVEVYTTWLLTVMTNMTTYFSHNRTDSPGIYPCENTHLLRSNSSYLPQLKSTVVMIMDK